ncbi:MAG: AraC family ligand binding domain-containing protein [Rhodocyclaceae bacterium]
MFKHPNEFVRFATVPDLPGVELYSARLVDHAFSPHVHETWSIGVIEAGVERFRYRGGAHLADAGTLVFLNPDEPHTGEAGATGGWRYRMLYLDANAFSPLLGRSAYFPVPTVRDPQAARRLATALTRIEQADEPLAAQQALLDLIDDVVVRHAQACEVRAPADGRARFRQLLEYIEAHLDQPLDLGRLAGLSGLSMHHFARSFAAAMHLSPHRYVQARRLLRAKHLLAARRPASEVAAEVGLTDQSHLTRWFRQTYGVTPAQYQAQLGRPRSGRVP